VKFQDDDFIEKGDMLSVTVHFCCSNSTDAG